jgi:hypothetical protein
MSPRHCTLRLLLLPSAVALVAAGCYGPGVGTPTRPSTRRGLITAQDIAQSSADNAWELLRQRASAYRFVEDRYGEPLTIKTRRGRSTLSLVDGDTPLVILDGARLVDFRALRQIPTTVIASVQLSGGIRGTTTQGTNAAAGVIVITTKVAPDSVNPP